MATLGAGSGANMSRAEVGPNPRAVDATTEHGRGLDSAAWRTTFAEAEHEVLEEPSLIDTKSVAAAAAVVRA